MSLRKSLFHIPVEAVFLVNCRLTLIMSLRKSLFQIPVEVVFVSELSLIKLMLGFKKRVLVLPH